MTSLRLCALTIGHPAKDARVFYRILQPLAKKGCAVVLIAPEPFTDDLVRMSPWNSVMAQSNRTKRLILALRAALAERADIYSFHDPDLIPVGFALKLLRPSAAVVYDALEDYPSMMLVKYWIPKSLRPILARATHFLNLVAGRYLDGIVTADPGVQQDFKRAARHKSIVHYNFPPLGQFQQTKDEPPAVRADLVYVGGMSERTGMFVLLDALAILARRGLKPTLRLAGYSDGEKGLDAIKEGISRRNLSMQVELHGKIPYTQVPAWIRSGRIGLVPLQPIAKFMKNIPTKMFEYWAFGLPVIASDLPPIRPFVMDGKNGLLFKASDPEDLARAIDWLLSHPVAGKKMGEMGREQVHTDWNIDRHIGDLLDFYQQISASSDRRSISSQPQPS
jgi:glycosyltransferase involved in cell wall biosynthesis